MLVSIPPYREGEGGVHGAGWSRQAPSQPLPGRLRTSEIPYRDVFFWFSSHKLCFLGASPLAVKSKWLWDQTSRVPCRLNLTSPKVQGPRGLDLPEPCSVCGLSRGQGGRVEILPDTEATGPDHPPLETKTCLPGLVVYGHHCTLTCNRTCVCVFGSEETKRGAVGREDKKEKRIPKVSFTSLLNTAPGELLRQFSFSRVSWQLPPPSMSV